MQISVGRKPVTGLRLCLEGSKQNRLSIHLQHLASLPKILRPHWDTHVAIGPPKWQGPEEQDSRWFEPIKWKNFAHVSTSPIENTETNIGDLSGVYVVTGAQLGVWDFVHKSVLHLKLLFSKVPGCTIRRSVWDHSPTTNLTQRPDDTSSSSSSSSDNSSKLRKIVDFTEMSKGPQDNPGHWLVTGAKLGVEKDNSLHINCGGKETIVDGTIYDQDTEERGAAMCSIGSNPNWAFSSTGNFMDDDRDPDNYIARNASAFSMSNSELYTSARLSPLSLTYYGLCMLNGDYTVKLHFAETFFTNDSTFTSLGKRVFNVYVQGRLVLQDFNIADAAGGPGKPTIKTFLTSISDNTLHIQFYWAGKGTTGIPTRGVYGPLVSAISVTSNFEPPTESGYNHRRTQIAIWVSFLSLLLILTLSGICWWRRWRETFSVSRDHGGLDLQNGSFSLRQIKAATRNFDARNKIGEGGFGSVYKGLLSEGTVVAVKQLSSRSKQGNREFVNEIGMISALQHPNLVKLHGCCIEGNQLILIYEYMENNCLSRALFGSDPQLKLKLDWPTRRKICIGIARGLTYLHEESRLKIIHRDIKASNILLDNDLNAKISDFGLAKLNEEDHSHISTRVAGTIGYIAPEYAMRGCLTNKADIYSFGVVALEIVTGKSNTNYRSKEEFVYLLDWAYVLQEKGTLLELVDPELGSEYCEEEALLMLNVALLCTNASPTLRPSMSKVVSLLQGQTPLQPLLSYLSFSANCSSTTGMRRCFWQNPNETQIVSISASYAADSSPNSSGQENEASIVIAKASPNTIC